MPNSSSPTYIVAIPNAPVFEIQGADVVDLLQRVSTNDVNPLARGIGVSTIFTSEKGRITEWAAIVPREEHDRYVMFLAGCYEEDFGAWLSRYIILEDVVVGPKPLSNGHWIVYTEDFSLSGLPGDLPDVLSRNRFLAADEQYRGKHWVRITDLDASESSQSELLEALAHVNAVSFSDFEKARIGAGIPWAGTELSDQYTPMEALAREHISFVKGCYVGQEVIARIDAYRKLSKVLVRVRGHGTAATGTLLADAKACGTVTSAVQLGANEWAGLAYVRQQAMTADHLVVEGGHDPITIVDRSHFDIAYGESNV